MWTKFWDMHSGGGQKEEWAVIYIEAPEEEAIVIFYNRFGHNPDRVTCTCCGNDYSIDSGKSLKQLSGYHRGCRYAGKKGYIEKRDTTYDKYANGEKELEETKVRHPYQTLEEYEKRPDVLIIYAKDIKPEERLGEVPTQGYVWQD